MELALRKLDDGDVSISRAAEIADVSVWDIATLAAERDVTWVGSDHLADDLDEL